MDSLRPQATKVDLPRSTADNAVQFKSPDSQYFRTDHLMPDLRARSIRGGAVTTSAQAVKFALNLGSTAVLARLLTPADFGLMAMVAAFTGFVALFRDLGLAMATVQRAEITHSQVSMLFWINTAMSVLLMGMSTAVAPAVAWLYGETRLTWIMIAIAATLPFGGLSAQHIALMRRQMRFTALAAVEIASLVVGSAVAISMAWRGFSYWSLVAMGAASGACTMTLCWGLSGWRPSLPRRGSGVMPMLAFGGGLTSFNILNYFTRNADNVIVGVVLGSGPLGIYSKAYNLLMAPIKQFNAPIASVMQPTLSRLQHDPARYRRAHLRAVSMLAFIGMPLVSFTFVAADDVVRLFLGPGWDEAVPVFRLLAPAALLGTLNVAPIWLCTTLGRTRIQLYWALISAPVTVVAFFVGARWGVNGVAIAFSLTWCCLLLGFVAMACHRSPVAVADLVRSVAPILLAATGAAALTMWLWSVSGLQSAGPLLRVCMSGCCFVAAYIGLTVVTPSGRARFRTLWRDGVASLGKAEALT